MTIDERIGAPVRGAAAASDGAAASGFRSHARVRTELRSSPDGHGRSCVTTLRSEAPLVLRLAHRKSPEPWAAHAADVARVSLAAGAAGPIGGDRLTLHIEVGPGSALVLSEVSPTLVLPGPHGEPSSTYVRITVGSGGTLIWLPEPIIAAAGCDHLNDVRVELDEGARLYMREEVLLGRHGEMSGRLTQRVAVRLAGRPLHRQDLGIGTPGAASPAVVGAARAVGSALVVDPAWADQAPETCLLGPQAALLPLAGPAVLVTAVAEDNLALRAHLRAGLAALGPPWDPSSALTP